MKAKSLEDQEETEDCLCPVESQHQWPHLLACQGRTIRFAVRESYGKNTTAI